MKSGVRLNSGNIVMLRYFRNGNLPLWGLNRFRLRCQEIMSRLLLTKNQFFQRVKKLNRISIDFS